MKIFESREEMLSHYLKEDLVGAEIGVFQGILSDFLFSKNPKRLYLVDIFEGICGSGDADGNNFIYIDLANSLSYLKDKYKKSNNVEIVKANSDVFFHSINDDFLDYVYIDGDHSYSGVLKDLESSRFKVKNNGYIFGHDYSINNNKTKQRYDFGVKKAAHDFCNKYKLYIESMANDGCTSFCIKNIK